MTHITIEDIAAMVEAINKLEKKLGIEPITMKNVDDTYDLELQHGRRDAVKELQSQVKDLEHAITFLPWVEQLRSIFGEKALVVGLYGVSTTEFVAEYDVDVLNALIANPELGRATAEHNMRIWKELEAKLAKRGLAFYDVEDMPDVQYMVLRTHPLDDEETDEHRQIQEAFQAHFGFNCGKLGTKEDYNQNTSLKILDRTYNWNNVGALLALQIINEQADTF